MIIRPTSSDVFHSDNVRDSRQDITPKSFTFFQIHTHTFRHHYFLSSHLKAGFCGISLYLLSVDDHLDNPVPDLLTDIVPSQTNQVKDCVHIPGVVMSILLRQNSYLQNLELGRQGNITCMYRCTEALDSVGEEKLMHAHTTITLIFQIYQNVLLALRLTTNNYVFKGN